MPYACHVAPGKLVSRRTENGLCMSCQEITAPQVVDHTDQSRLARSLQLASKSSEFHVVASNYCGQYSAQPKNFRFISRLVKSP